jgi:hypothetical protein
MNKQQTFLGALGLGFISVIFFMAGSGSFEILPRKMANFIGMIFALSSGFMWLIYGLKATKE